MCKPCLGRLAQKNVSKSVLGASGRIDTGPRQPCGSAQLISTLRCPGTIILTAKPVTNCDVACSAALSDQVLVGETVQAHYG